MRCWADGELFRIINYCRHNYLVSGTGEKYWPAGQEALVKIGWQSLSLADWAVPGGHLHSAIVPPPSADGPNSIVFGHGAPIFKIKPFELSIMPKIQPLIKLNLMYVISKLSG